MLVRLWILFLLLSPALALAGLADEKKQDLELFEFLAMFDQKDGLYLDAEMDDAKTNVQQRVKNSKVTKSESNEK